MRFCQKQFDLGDRNDQPLENHFGQKVLTMLSIRSVNHLSSTYQNLMVAI
jgi:hypothetical protein